MADFPNYYKILQVDPSAEQVVIDAAYKRLSLKYHPDQNKSPDTTRRMQQINEAYDILRDPVRRSAYDRSQPNKTSRNSSHEAYQQTEYERQRMEAAENARDDAKREAEYYKRKAEEEQRNSSTNAQNYEHVQAAYKRAEDERVKREETEKARKQCLGSSLVIEFLSMLSCSQPGSITSPCYSPKYVGPRNIINPAGESGLKSKQLFLPT